MSFFEVTYTDGSVEEICAEDGVACGRSHGFAAPNGAMTVPSGDSATGQGVPDDPGLVGDLGQR